MTANSGTVRLFTVPQQFPCGPQSSCCGPIGQSEEEIRELTNTIEKEIGCPVEIVNVTEYDKAINHPGVVRLLQSFGPAALPIITIDEEVISMGNATTDEAVSAIKDAMAQR
jgi:hypothetical protein